MKAPFELIDSHIHYWQADTPDRPWVVGGALPDTAPWSVDQIVAAAEAAGVSRVVQVVPSLMGYDNRYGFEGAEQCPDKVAGVFARIDPLAADMPARLAALRAHPKFMASG